MGKKYFVAGTDTGVGKTLVASALLSLANQSGQRTLGLKPIAAGCEEREWEGDLTWVNEDALLLQAHSSVKPSYEQVNPIALKEAVAPHIAAMHENRMLSIDRIVGFLRGAMMAPSDLCLVEGAGGWRVPLNTREYISGIAKALNLPVILVVGMRLGCINHALLTKEAIERDGLKVAGWVANTIDPEMPVLQENIDTLVSLISAPLIGVIPNIDSPIPSVVAEYLDINKLII